MLVPDSALTLARIADAPAIAERSRTLIETGLPWSWVPRRVEASIRHPETNVWVAQVREGIAGCTLLVYVDDATSRIVLARFVVSESTVSYMRATRDYVRQYGKPLAFYSDCHTVFSVNGGEKLSGNGVTQFCRALRELGIELICALSSPAKGRVERAHLTLQDRLVKERGGPGCLNRI